MNNITSRHSALVLAVAAVAVLPTVGQAVDRIYTGGTATNGTVYTTLTNWNPTGTYGGVITPGEGVTAPTGGGAIDDVVFTNTSHATSGFGVNFGGAPVAAAINGGTLTLGALVYNTSTLAGASTTTMLFGNVGTTGLNVAGSGTLSITGTVAFTGATVNVGATGGTLNNIVAAITDTATSNLSLTNQSVGTAPTGGTTLTYAINGAQSGFYVPTGRTLRLIPGITEGTAGSGIVKYGVGTLELGIQTNGRVYTNTYTGTTTINQGTLIIDNGAGTLGTGPVVINDGGRLQGNFNGFTFAAGRAFTLNGATEINNNTYTSFINGTVGGSGTFAKTGSATLFLNGTANTFTGTYAVGNASTLGFSVAGSFGPAGNVVALNGINSGMSLDNVGTAGSTIPVGIALQLNDATVGNRVSVATSETWTFAGPISGTGNFIKTGSGSLNLSGALTYTGTTTLNSGNLYINSVLTSTAGTTANVATQIAGIGTINGNVAVNGGTISSGTSANIIGALTVNGDVSLNQATPGILKSDFSTVNNGFDQLTVNGTLDVTGGTYNITGLAAVNDAVYTLATGTTVTGTFANTLGLVGGYSVDTSGNQVRLIRGNTKLTFNANNSGAFGDATNFTTDAAGLNATAQFPTASADVTFGNNALTNAANFASSIAATTYVNSLTFANAAPSSISQANVGTGTLVVKGTGINLPAGTGIVVNPGAGAVSISTPLSIANGVNQTWANNASNPLTISGTVALGTNTLSVGGSGVTTVSGVVSGSGGLTATGSGTVMLTAANTYLGTTTVNKSGGVLKLDTTSQPNLLASAAGIDIRNGAVSFASADADIIKSLLVSGHAAGFTTGTIRSSLATATRGLGYRDTGAGEFIVKAALYGDADLDGGVSINDFNALAGNFGQGSGKVWVDGDFDYDGGVSINDFNLLAGGFGQSLPPTSELWAGLLAFAAAHDDMAAFAAITGVPEPTSLGLVAAGATLGLRRRRR